MRLREYLDDFGRSPFGAWFGGLDAQAAARVSVSLTRIERGNLSNVEPAPAARRRNRQTAVGRLQGPEEERHRLMALTRAFKDTVLARVQSDPAFREALLREGVNALLEGDVDAGKAILRDYIKATVGFEALAVTTGAPSKSLMRMFSPRGNPTAGNLFAVIRELQRASGVTLEVVAGA